MGYEAFTSAQRMAIQNGQAAREEMRTTQDRNALSQATQAYVSGDTAGARNALAQGGNLDGVMALDADKERRDSAASTQATAVRDRQRTFLVQGASGLRQLPPEQRAAAFNTRVLPMLQREGFTPEMLAQITPDVLADDAALDSVIAMGGGESRGNAPSGYRYAGNGHLEFIPGGPEDPKNQRWQVTPYGLTPPPGWSPPEGQGRPRSLGSAVPQGWSAAPPNPNQPAPGQPVRATSERAQTPTVSFRSSSEARSRVSQIVPGVNVTNGDRTPDDTARIRRQGYNPSDTSFHLQGQALDLTPPRGMSMAQLEQQMRQAGFRVLNEGHHVHVSW